jgi:hypothetical protein
MPDGAGSGGAGASGNGGTGGTGGAAAGSGGTSGSGGTGDAAYEQCLSDAVNAGQEVGDCARCLCQADNCQARLNTATHDAKANAVVICSQQQSCTDLCCLCGSNSCGSENYATGPCSDEIESAAGVTPGGGLLNALTVSAKCTRSATDDNSCYRATVLADCEREKCAEVCPISTSCQ